jgi:hypothetical protein
LMSVNNLFTKITTVACDTKRGYQN